MLVKIMQAFQGEIKAKLSRVQRLFKATAKLNHYILAFDFIPAHHPWADRQGRLPIFRWPASPGLSDHLITSRRSLEITLTVMKIRRAKTAPSAADGRVVRCSRPSLCSWLSTRAR